jgi:predicted kinase
MRKWMRERMKRRKKSSENTSESTGKIGQAIDRTLPAPLMPSYESSSAAGEDEEAEADDETFGDVNDAPSEPTRPGQLVVETQPESPNTPPAAADAAMRKAPGKREPRGVVVLAIGLPGSGKTTWFKRRGVTPLSSDMLRSILFDSITEQRYQGLVFSTLRSLLRARLIAKMPWNYVDATNLSPHERRQWIKMARGFGYEAQAVFFDVPLELCLERNRKRERQVQEDVMRQMASKLKPPTFKEGFSKIVVVRVKKAETE